MDKKSLIHEIKVIDGDIFRAISNRYKGMNIDITPMHAKIIMTIYKSKELLCQKDLEASISCNKSTMSAIISTMEKNGLLIRKSCEQDSRINYLELTDKGIDMALFLKKDRKVTEDIMLEGITEEDYLLFTEIVNKIRKNLERI
jgi:DNA-binding MarR family transcriptional regulator